MKKSQLTIDFEFPSGVRRAELRRQLSERLNLRAAGRRTGTAFLDTFDWRLHRAGWSLEVVDKPRQAILRALDDGRVVQQPLAGPPPPRTVADLTRGSQP